MELAYKQGGVTMRKKILFVLTTVTLVIVMAMTAQARGGMRQGQMACFDQRACVFNQLCQNDREAMQCYFERGYRLDVSEAGAYVVCPRGERMCMNDDRLSNELASWARAALECEFCAGNGQMQRFGCGRAAGQLRAGACNCRVANRQACRNIR